MGKDEVDLADRDDHIKHFPVGTIFDSRKELSDARVHPPLESGIYKGPGGDEVPAKSIVMANRPEYPNEDHGETFTYIGMGGRGDVDDHEEEEEGTGLRRKKRRAKKSTHGGLQTRDQSFDHAMNKALREAAIQGIRVRVTRGAGASKFAPPQGYRYDGLYFVHNPRLEMGPSGKLVCKFDFERYTKQPPLPTNALP